MLVISRIEMVIGRIISLVSSMIVRMGDSGRGLPWGVRWINTFLRFLLDFIIMIITNRVILVGMTVEASELVVNENGVRENRFRNKISMNRLIII